MSRRTIKTLDSQVFTDRASRFEDRKGYVLYRRSPFQTVRISKRGIISDDISGFQEFSMHSLILILSLILVIGILIQSGLLSIQSTEISGGQNNAYANLKDKMLYVLSLLIGFAAITFMFKAAYAWWQRKRRRELNRIKEQNKELFDRIRKQVSEETRPTE